MSASLLIYVTCWKYELILSKNVLKRSRQTESSQYSWAESLKGAHPLSNFAVLRRAYGGKCTEPIFGIMTKSWI